MPAMCSRSAICSGDASTATYSRSHDTGTRRLGIYNGRATSGFAERSEP